MSPWWVQPITFFIFPLNQPGLSIHTFIHLNQDPRDDPKPSLLTNPSLSPPSPSFRTFRIKSKLLGLWPMVYDQVLPTFVVSFSSSQPCTLYSTRVEQCVAPVTSLLIHTSMIPHALTADCFCSWIVFLTTLGKEKNNVPSILLSSLAGTPVTKGKLTREKQTEVY